MKPKDKYGIYIFLILVFYIVVPSPLQLILLLILIFIVFKKPETAAILLIATPIFDRLYIIPYWERSIVLLIFPIAFISLLFVYKIQKTIVSILPVTITTITLLIYNTIKGFGVVSDHSGFNDPSRGIIFLISIMYIILLFFNNRSADMIIDIKKRLWIVPALFVISIPISVIIYPDYIVEMRFQGTMGDPNYFGRYALICILISVFSIKNKIKSLWSVLFILIFVLLSASKSAILVIIFSVLYFLLKSKIRHKFLWFSLIALLLVSLSFTDISDLLLSRFTIDSPINIRGTRIYNKIDIITSGRTYLWRFFISEFDLNHSGFYLGSGISSSSSFFNPLFGENFMAHNSFIEVLIDLGIIGFSILFYSLYRLMKIPSNLKVVRESIFPYLIIIFLFYNFTLSGFWVKQNIALIFLILLTYGIQRKIPN